MNRPMKDTISQKAVYLSSLIFSVAVLLWMAFQITVYLFGPSLEMTIIKPLHHLSFENVECVDVSDGIAVAYLNKTAYPFGTHAKYKSLSLYTTDSIPHRLAWSRVVEDDNSPEDRPAGEQYFKIYIFDGCNKEFVAYTRHRSPISGLTLEMKWGPFNTVDDRRNRPS